MPIDDWEQIAQENSLWPWLADGSMADEYEPYEPYEPEEDEQWDENDN